MGQPRKHVIKDANDDKCVLQYCKMIKYLHTCLGAAGQYTCEHLIRSMNHIVGLRVPLDLFNVTYQSMRCACPYGAVFEKGDTLAHGGYTFPARAA